ncbi:hypothetical protein PBRA_006918 [Plasmodiophora brassicae]|uniref:Uncharacterized protein n=1 Tax=Plasmodiophora brassicae TaxID=37360 RepID=A0A0G4IUJ4_PLABS|nr:hypothetical protein PBRA_006918 [Plasmodiophora brassicae]
MKGLRSPAVRSPLEVRRRGLPQAAGVRSNPNTHLGGSVSVSRVMESVSKSHEECLITLKSDLDRLGFDRNDFAGSVKRNSHAVDDALVIVQRYLDTWAKCSIAAMYKEKLMQCLSSAEVIHRHDDSVIMPPSRSPVISAVASSSTQPLSRSRDQVVVDVASVPACFDTVKRPPSHQKVSCPVGNCRSVMRRDSLKQHIETIHRNARTINSKTKRTPSSSSQTRIFDFIKRPRLDEVTSPSVSGDRAGMSASAPPQPDHSAAQHPVDVGALSRCGSSTVLSASSPLPESSCQPREATEDTTLPHGSMLKGISLFYSQMQTLTDSLRDDLSDLPGRIARAVVDVQNQDALNKAIEESANRVRGKTIDEIAELNHLVRVDGALRCAPCDKFGSLHLTPGAQGVTGIFSVDQDLKKLKYAIDRHFRKPNHRTCTEKAAADERYRRNRLIEAMNVARTAYRVIFEAQSYLFFEREIAHMYVCGARVGSLNHSCKFIEKFLPALRSVMVKRMAAWIDELDPVIGNRKRPFSICADKSTELRRTGQIVGLVMLVDGTVTAMMVDNRIVNSGGDDGTATGLAHSLMSSVAKVLPHESEYRERLTGMAFDGQYIRDGVPAAVRDIVSSESSSSWLTSVWDPAHIVELAVNDVRKDKTGTIPLNNVEWYSTLAANVGFVVNETRFAASEVVVYRNFLRNYALYVTYFVEKSSVPPGRRKNRSKDEQKAFERLQLLRDMLFVGRVLVVHDMLSHIKKFSLYAQTVNVLPWELLEKGDELLSVFRQIEMCTRADASSRELPDTLFPSITTSGTTWQEFVKGEFHGIALTLPMIDEFACDDRRYALADVPKVLMDEVYDFAKAFGHFFETRFVNCRSAPRQGDSGGHQFFDVAGHHARELIKSMGQCFDLRKLCLSPCPLGRRREGLEFVVDAATTGGVHLPVLSTMHRQLETLRLRLVDKATRDAKWFEAEVRGKPGTSILKCVFTEEDLYKDIPDIMYLLEHCVLKVSNEAVVEGMGCIIARHAAPGRHLSERSIADEAFIHYNGPDPSNADGILNDALDVYFKGGDHHFSQTSLKGQASPFAVIGKVVKGYLNRRIAKVPTLESNK